MNEIWKKVINFDNYEVSNLGRVRSIDRYELYRDKFHKGRILKQFLQNGYPKVSFSINGSTCQRFVHRLVAEAFIPNPDNKPQIDHIDTNRSNNCVDNLRWVTQEENLNNPLTVEHRKESQQKFKEKSIEEKIFEITKDEYKYQDIIITNKIKSIKGTKLIWM